VTDLFGWTALAMSCILHVEVFMRADQVEVSWDTGKRKWLVRIQAGDEVIRRHCDQPENADEQSLRLAAQSTLQDEGYDPDLSRLSILR
jgi:hypothetical protein